MEDLDKLLGMSETFPMQLEQMSEEFLVKLRVILWGQTAVTASNKEKLKDLPAASPQQTKKRAKRLPSLNEDNESEAVSKKSTSPRKSKRSNAELLVAAEAIEDACTQNGPIDSGTIVDKNQAEENVKKSDASNLMPPPPIPSASTADETFNKRPQRAARLKAEKNLKEPNVGSKLRRPTDDEIKIKFEHEQRPSQMHDATINSKEDSSSTPSLKEDSASNCLSQKSDDSVIVVPGKQPSIISINSDIQDVATKDQGNKSANSTDGEIREICIKIKREKVSLDVVQSDAASHQPVFKAPDVLPVPISAVRNDNTTTIEETSLASSILSATTNTTNNVPSKRGRKKKEVHKPIKVERFSDLDPKPSPVASRTRHGSLSKTENIETSPTKETKRPTSIYEDAIETPPSRNSKDICNSTTTIAGIINETVTLGPAADATITLGTLPSDATFCTNPAQTTFSIAPGQTTFVSSSDKDKEDEAVGQRSFETAKNSSMGHDDTLLTEEEEPEKPKVSKSKISASNKVKATSKASSSGKAGYKMSARTIELFNPLAQSPVKMRVEAFENAVAAATENAKRPIRNKKENVTPTSVTTPVIGKLAAPALGRFLTPTQGSNITTLSSGIAKKATTSASKALPMPKSTVASSLQRSNSAVSTKTLQRENSTDDFRKGLHNLAEERKKQREQKHLQAAQQREAKERERAERLAKLAKEREEKRLLKKQHEQEQKKRELEEIQRKLRQQQEEDAAKLKAAREREMLLQMKQQQQLAKQKMMPPPPKTSSKYTFEMLHEDDSTDEEDKVSYKRPPPPSWSRRHVRGPNVLKQEYIPSAYIDSFFSVQPMTPDLKIIFPNIDSRHLKRNSSVLWSTPPRYSELPKY